MCKHQLLTLPSIFAREFDASILLFDSVKPLDIAWDRVRFRAMELVPNDFSGFDAFRAFSTSSSTYTDEWNQHRKTVQWKYKRTHACEHSFGYNLTLAFAECSWLAFFSPKILRIVSDRVRFSVFSVGVNEFSWLDALPAFLTRLLTCIE